MNLCSCDVTGVDLTVGDVCHTQTIGKKWISEKKKNFVKHSSNTFYFVNQKVDLISQDGRPGSPFEGRVEVT